MDRVTYQLYYAPRLRKIRLRTHNDVMLLIQHLTDEEVRQLYNILTTAYLEWRKTEWNAFMGTNQHGVRLLDHRGGFILYFSWILIDMLRIYLKATHTEWDVAADKRASAAMMRLADDNNTTTRSYWKGDGEKN